MRTFAMPQLVDAGQVEARETLPSFHYQPAAGELPAGALRLPWSRESPAYAVGFFAREQGGRAPGPADRLGQVLAVPLRRGPHGRPAALAGRGGRRAAVAGRGQRPVPAAHPRRLERTASAASRWPSRTWSLTLPASFDEVARELTVQAAAAAGLPRVVLIEEPQAAFYAWIDAHAGDWEQRVAAGQKILVCDIGGGTTDFTLIRVRRGEGGKVQFHRVAVGEHLILGGDNLDLALAKPPGEPAGRPAAAAAVGGAGPRCASGSRRSCSAKPRRDG